MKLLLLATFAVTACLGQYNAPSYTPPRYDGGKSITTYHGFPEQQQYSGKQQQGYAGGSQAGYGGSQAGYGGSPAQGYEREEEPKYYGPPRPYQFDYTVKDNHYGSNFYRNEQNDGQKLLGSYSVALPDGRIQTVEYIADQKNGFQAKVTYKGEAQYPDELYPAKPGQAGYKGPQQQSGGYKPQQPSYQPSFKPSYRPPPNYN